MSDKRIAVEKAVDNRYDTLLRATGGPTRKLVPSECAVDPFARSIVTIAVNVTVREKAIRDRAISVQEIWTVRTLLAIHPSDILNPAAIQCRAAEQGDTRLAGSGDATAFKL